MSYKLGIDLGTSYFKFGIYDEHLNLKGLGRVSVEKDKGNDSICEIPVPRFITLLKTGIHQACQQAQTPPEDISSIAYSSQANSFLLLDKNYSPLTPLVLWPDQRAEKRYPEVEFLWNHEEFPEATGIGIAPSPALCINKLLWFKHNHPTLWKEVKHVMTISDYLAYLFTGNKAGDLGTASLLGLLDCKNGIYWDKAFEILKLNKDLFSKRVNVGTLIGRTHPDAGKVAGIKIGTPFYAGSLDHHMAAFGADLKGNADLSISLGTVLACVNFTDQYVSQKGVCISPWSNNRFCQLSFNENGAVSLEWYRNKFAPEYSLNMIDKMAIEAGGSDGLIAKPTAFKYSNLETAFENVKPYHTHGHFICALMESTARTLQELVDKHCSVHRPRNIVATGGGAQSDLWLKICSEKLQTTIFRSDCLEPATKGAAMITQ